jgi:predicted amidohydrolase
MQVTDVSQVLGVHGLVNPRLELLRPTEASYRALMLQPAGPIYAGPDRIGPLDRTNNEVRSRAFLDLATSRGAHLAVTPEYFLSWAALEDALSHGAVPPHDGLWVLGCESAREQDIQAFAARLGAACLVLHEPFGALSADRELLDPAALVFHAVRADGTTQLVCLLQFKTYPSRDDLFVEESLLRRGTTVYRFRDDDGGLTATAIICSDAFEVPAHIGRLVDRGTLVHIQLNPAPRNSTYRQYRTDAFRIDSRMSDCHIVCLNWARNIVQHAPGAPADEWKNVSGSAWYCPENACSCQDGLVLPNHKLGLYYTYMQDDRRHALFLHYDEMALELQVPKVVTAGLAVMANKNGPSATRRYEWNAAASAWSVVPHDADSGFEALLNADADVTAALAAAAATHNPIELERLLALCAGAVAANETWYAPRHIDSFQVKSDEVVRRITFTQDKAGADFRHKRLVAAAQVRNLLDTVTSWPAQVKSLSAGATIRAAAPHFNVEDVNGRPALIAYLGESPSRGEVENSSASLVNLLQRVGGENYMRVCVAFRKFGAVKFASMPGLTRFDDPLQDQTDFLVVDPEGGNS